MRIWKSEALLGQLLTAACANACMPFHYAFRMSSWLSGFLKRQMSSMTKINRANKLSFSAV